MTTSATDGRMPSRLPSLASIASHTAAFGFIAASTAIGATFGYMLGSTYGPFLGGIFALAAVAGELAKPLAVSATFRSFASWQFGRGLACLTLALACLTYSIAADLGLSTMLRSDLAAARASETRSVADARARRDRAAQDLAALPPARPSSELAPMIASLKATDKRLNGCGAEWLATSALRARCIDIARLEAEKARADRRAQLEDTIRVAEADGSAARQIEADPLAASVSAYAGAFGFKVSAEQVSPWLALLLPGLLEIGSAFGLLLCSVGPTPTQRPTDEQPQTPEFPPSVQPVQPCTVEPVAARDRVLALIREAGGTTHGSVRGLAEQAGTSPTRFRQVVGELSEAGAVKVRTGTTGTTLALA